MKKTNQDTTYYALFEKIMLDPAVTSEKVEIFVAAVKDRNRLATQQAFNADMVCVQQELKTIPEDMKNKQTDSTYSSYKTLLKYAKPVYSKYGFALVFSEEDSVKKENNIRICVDVAHKKGYTRKYHTDIPIDNAGIKGTVNKTPTHAKGSSISYGRSYLMKMVFNLSTGKMDDDDGNGASSLEKASDLRIKQVKDLREKLKISEVDFKKRLKRRFNTDCPRNLNSQQILELVGTLKGMLA